MYQETSTFSSTSFFFFDKEIFSLTKKQRIQETSREKKHTHTQQQIPKTPNLQHEGEEKGFFFW